MLVTGIQPRRVCVVGGVFRAMDMALLDSCDEHRNEERLVATAIIRGPAAYFLTDAFQKYGHGAGSTPSSLVDFAETALKSPIFMKGASA